MTEPGGSASCAAGLRFARHLGVWTLLYCGQLRSATSYSPASIPFASLLTIIVISALVSTPIGMVARHLSKAGAAGWARLRNVAGMFGALLLVSMAVVQYREMIGWGLGQNMPKWPLAVVIAAAALGLWVGGTAARERLIQYLSAVGLLTLALATGSYLWQLHALPTMAITPLALVDAQPASKLIVLVFDELDGVLFNDRHREVQRRLLPNLGAYKSRSLDFGVATAHVDNTFEAIPSILAGKELYSIDKVAMRDAWRASDGVIVDGFDQVLQQGLLNTNLRFAGKTQSFVGWYHPYCRWVPDQTRCVQLDSADGLYDAFLYVYNSAAWCRHLGLCLWGRDRAAHPYRAVRLLREVERLLPASAVLFIHVPLPHPPCAKFSVRGDEIRIGKERLNCSYADSLQLADHVFGQLMRIVERDCRGCNVTVAVTSDHPYRLWRQAPAQQAATRVKLSDAMASALVDELALPRAPMLVPFFIYNRRLDARLCKRPVSNHEILAMAAAVDSAAAYAGAPPC